MQRWLPLKRWRLHCSISRSRGRRIFLQGFQRNFGWCDARLASMRYPAGYAPGGAVTFLLRKRKVTKRKAPPLSASQRYRAGKPAVLRFGRGLAKLACGSNNASPDPPKAVLLGAYRGGPRGSGSVAQRATSRLGREPGCAGLGLAVRLLVLVVRSHAVWRRRVAQGWADQGPRLSEAVGRVRAGPRSDRATQRARSAAQGRRLRLAFSLVTFFWRSKRNVTAPPGAHPGLPIDVNGLAENAPTK
ncbi:hypothetical protein SAMN05216303_1011143 [Rhodoferax sp. OV413]|nr:hypothetical protein SAMN05216303_1011143 [Rhodoferax sp. OV413]